MIEPLDIEVFNDKEVVLYDVVDYDVNIANRIISEEKKREIEKINEEFSNIVRENKLMFSTDIGKINH